MMGAEYRPGHQPGRTQKEDRCYIIQPRATRAETSQGVAVCVQDGESNKRPKVCWDRLIFLREWLNQHSSDYVRLRLKA